MRILTTPVICRCSSNTALTARSILDKHSVGGLPGNRTTPIVVAVVAAHGLTMPKTSSRAITSPAGTADTMETLAPVDLDLPSIRRVVEQESGCTSLEAFCKTAGGDIEMTYCVPFNPIFSTSAPHFTRSDLM